MHLTVYTENAFRVLLHLADHDNKLATVSEISKAFNVSRNHIAKVVHHLGVSGFIKTHQGLHGGIRLAKDPESINVSDVVDEIEKERDIFKCFSEPDPDCPYVIDCKLKSALEKASQGFMDVLKQYTLADLMVDKNPSSTVTEEKIIFPPIK
jgi:Rrf2 family nitric oxide-sensitive transcriptional repressor